MIKDTRPLEEGIATRSVQMTIEKDHSENGCVDYFLSGCCGAGEHDVDNFCGACAEFAEFDCSVCEKTRDDSGR